MSQAYYTIRLIKFISGKTGMLLFASYEEALQYHEEYLKSDPTFEVGKIPYFKEEIRVSEFGMPTIEEGVEQ